MSTRNRPAAGDSERRSLPVQQFEIRATAEELVLEGYASVFDAPYEMYGGPEKGGWMEVVDRRAFDRTLNLKPDVQLLINHAGMPLARTKSGTLDLATDRKGLHVRARLDPSDPDVKALEPKMRRGDMDEMSFAFRTIRHEWTEDEAERRLLELSLEKGDVSVVNYGANPATSASVRMLTEALAILGETESEDLLAELRSAGDIHQIAAAHRTLGDVLAQIRQPSSRTPIALLDPRVP